MEELIVNLKNNSNNKKCFKNISCYNFNSPKNYFDHEKSISVNLRRMVRISAEKINKIILSAVFNEIILSKQSFLYF